MQKSPTFPAGTEFPIALPWPDRLFSKFTSTDETRWILNGVAITNGHFYATDGRKLIKLPAPEQCLGVSVVIPNNLIAAIESDATEVIATRDDEDGEMIDIRRGWRAIKPVNLWEKHATYQRADGLTVSADYIEGNLPQFDEVIPQKDTNGRVVYLSAAFLHEIAQGLAGDEDGDALKITIDIRDHRAPMHISRPEKTDVALLMPMRR